MAGYLSVYNNKSVIYYGGSQSDGNDCIIFHQVYGIATLSAQYVLVHITSYLISWADDTPNIITKTFNTEEALFEEINKLKLEYNLINLDY